MQKRAGSDRLPPWFKVRLTMSERSAEVRSLVRLHKLHTVCTSAACPNLAECWNRGTATFMILGNLCTRGCNFCNVSKGIPQPIDPDEPYRVARTIQSLQLRYAVITSVTRDDLADGGASLFAETIEAINAIVPGCRVEVLIPDFQGSAGALHCVLDAGPHVLGHNLETVPSQYRRVRPQADYGRSIDLLARARQHGAVTKTGLMLGVGETREEVLAVMRDLRRIECSILTLGQYLRPTKLHLPVEKYYHPDEFEALRKNALSMGFRYVAAGPLVRSSYHAEQFHS